MTKFKTEQITVGKEGKNLQFNIEININKDGSFVTTLPKNIMELFKNANIDMRHNRCGTDGYFSEPTYDGLIKEVKEATLEYFSREMTGEKIIIQYAIQTQCSYALNIVGDVVPNPSEEWTKMKYPDNPKNRWKEGTIPINAMSRKPFGLLVYVRPLIKREYKYRSGETKAEYTGIRCDETEMAKTALEKGYFLSWLNDVPCISIPEEAKIKEIDYSENVCEFFVNMIKSICVLNEKIKDFLEPDSIKLIAEQKQKFLQ